jgi:pimeloyl-ACP methyl ester carboxylesterase
MSRTALSEFHPFRSASARDRYLASYDERARAWPVPSETATVHTDAGETFVRVSGPVDGDPLVLLNGIWCDSPMWPPVIIEALSTVYRTYAVDNVYDFGRSVNFRTTTSAAAYVEWLDQLFDGLALDTGVNLMGLSLGAWISAEYLLHAPHRLRGVVWLSPGGVVSPPASVKSVAAVPYYFAAMWSPSQKTVGALMRWLMPVAAHSDGALRESLDRYIENVALSLQCFTKRPTAKETNRRFSDAELREIEVPVLYVAGEHEKLNSARAMVSRLNAVAPQIETMILPNVGHELIMAEPEVFTRRAMQFLGTRRGLTEQARQPDAPEASALR